MVQVLGTAQYPRGDQNSRVVYGSDSVFVGLLSLQDQLEAKLERKKRLGLISVAPFPLGLLLTLTCFELKVSRRFSGTNINSAKKLAQSMEGSLKRRESSPLCP